MNSVQTHMYDQPYDMIDPYFSNGNQLQQHYLHQQQQIELERIRLVQQQAAIQQQKALFQSKIKRKRKRKKKN